MLTPQTIVIIGAGHTGKEIATRLLNGHFNLLICDADHAKAKALTRELKKVSNGCNVEAMECSFDSAWQSDIIILAMNFQDQKEAAAIIKEVVNQKTLVSIIDPGTEASGRFSCTPARLEILQELLPHTTIVNADIRKDDILITGKSDRAVGNIVATLESAGISSLQAENLSAIAIKSKV